MTSKPDFSSALTLFGQAIRKQRTLWGWTLEKTADEVLGNADRKSYVSAVERGKKKLSPLTIQKFATAFEIDDALVDALLSGAPDLDEPATQVEQDADRLNHETEALRQQLKLSEALAVALAYEYAEGNPTDLNGALRELRRAFEVAADQRARNALPSNVDEAVDRVLAEVNALNDAGEVEEAGTALRRALADQAEEIARQEAAQLRLIEAGLAQATLERDVVWAAALAIQRWQRETGTFQDLHRVQNQWYQRGSNRVLSFDLEVSVPLAEHLVTVAETKEQRGAALNDLGNALQTLGDRASDTAQLEEAVTAYRNALEVYTRDALPMDWAMTQNNLGIALQALGRRASDPTRLEEAITAYRNALEIKTREALPMHWAMTTFNLGLVHEAQFDLTGDAALWQAAEAHVLKAREVFDAGNATFYIEKSDRILARLRARRPAP